VEKYFGDINRSGGQAGGRRAGHPPAPIRIEMTDQVATAPVRIWSAPGMNDQRCRLAGRGHVGAGGLASSRLENALVRGKQLAVSVSADVEQFEQVSFINVSMDVKPGVDRKVAEAALDAQIAAFLKEGPNADEVNRAATAVSGEIGSLEVVGGFGGKGATLAEGLLYSGDPAQYAKDLAAIAAATRKRSRLPSITGWAARR
jgi:predicted Zn-dependent peptidase